MLLLVDRGLDVFLLIDDLFLLQQVLSVLLDLELQLLVGLDQLLPFPFDLSQQPLVLVLLLVQGFDLVFELLDQVEVGGCDFCVVCFDV